MDTQESKAGAPSADAPETRNPAFPAKAALAIAAAVLACCAAAAIAWTAASGQNDSHGYADDGPVAVSGAVSGGSDDAGGGSSQAAKATSTRVGDHAHQWVEGVETVHHDAETEQAEVPATYKTVIEDETVCNACQAVVTGKAAEHQSQTGHSSFTTNVPVEKQVVDQEAHTEEKVVKEAWDEEIPSGVWTCSTCGATRDTDPNAGAAR